MTPSKAIRRPFLAALFIAALGGGAAPGVASANSLGTVDGMPFWGHPYPYGYVYHRPPIECYDIRQVETPYGPMIQETWICDQPVSARY
ncbi:hypothetical protein [Methylocapsa acidiphila]|uniref:hypothetical protein n=1 Tax=Methylocapsa acidiphila TaxID=133552 RepID=UPI0003F60AF5|nr:hypothetical protein [Methylocapsa acidiphila]